MYSHVDLFAGIGGFSLASERAGFKTVAQVEINDFCTKVLQKHWPDVTRFRDVRECGRHNLPFRPTLLTGGVPCQPASTAGKRQGESDEHWLWGEAIRIVKEIEPRYVVFENVAGLRSLNDGDSYREILRSLASIGYDAEWTHLRAADVGAPHRRERIFIVAYANVGRRRQELASNAHGAAPCAVSMAHDNGTRHSGTDDEVRSGRDTVDACWTASVNELADYQSASISDQPRSIDGTALVNAIDRASSGIVTGDTPTRIRVDGRIAASSTEDVGNTTSRGTQPTQQSRRLRSTEQTNTELVNSNDQRCQEQRGDFAAKSPFIGTERTGELGDSQFAGLEGRSVTGMGSTEVTAPTATIGSVVHANSGRSGSIRGSTQEETQSRLGVFTYGLSERLVRLGREIRWPSRPGQAQYEWEASRTTSNLSGRVAKLKALGNSVVPQVVQAVLETVYARIQAEDNVRNTEATIE